MILIELKDALSAMDKLYKDDILKTGGETLESFDADRAKKALNDVWKITNAVIPVPCSECIYAVEETVTNSGVGKCTKVHGGYFGKYGYCSEGKPKNLDWLHERMER